MATWNHFKFLGCWEQTAIIVNPLSSELPKTEDFQLQFKLFVLPKVSLVYPIVVPIRVIAFKGEKCLLWYKQHGELVGKKSCSTS